MGKPKRSTRTSGSGSGDTPAADSSSTAGQSSGAAEPDTPAVADPLCLPPPPPPLPPPPTPPPAGGIGAVQAIDDNNKNNDINGGCPVNDAEFSEDFELIDEMEWGPRRGEDGYDTDQELAPRPNRTPASDKCDCVPPRTGWGCIDEETCILFACREECRKNCDCGHLCGNKRLTKQQFATLEVFDAGRKGKGLRLVAPATHDGGDDDDAGGSSTTTSTTPHVVVAAAKKGDLLCEYLGRAVREGALNRLFRQYQFDRRLYILSLGNGIYIDARRKGGVARYINHSCNPNCKVELWKVKGIMRAAVVALRTIQPGEEICFDYQWERKRGRAPTICHCGADGCRGTLEVRKTEASSSPLSTNGHWERFNSTTTTTTTVTGQPPPPPLMPDQTVVNRTVKIYSNEHQQYFLGDVSGYDAQRGLHCVLYHDDLNEVWEDLVHHPDWYILHETMDENAMIAKKVQRRRTYYNATATDPHATTNGGGGGGGTEQQQQLTASLLLERAKQLQQQQQQQQQCKNYRYVPYAVKEALWSQGIVDRCQRNYDVLIDAEEFGRPPVPANPDDMEEVEKYRALDAAWPDATTVWKLAIRGARVPDAYQFIERHVLGIEKKLLQQQQQQQDGPTAAGSSSLTTDNNNHNNHNAVEPDKQEMIFPRAIADGVKRNIGSVKERCQSVTITFIPSQSLSKRFGRLTLEAAVAADNQKAMDLLWTLCVDLCNEADKGRTVRHVHRDLGFLGCRLKPYEFDLLVARGSQHHHYHHHNNNNNNNTIGGGDSGDGELNGSPFVASFENVFQCSVWVQDPDDQGRLNSRNRMVGMHRSSRKVFFGCQPRELSRLAATVKGRIADLQRGVHYLFLGSDRVYMNLMLQYNCFDFVTRLTGASVSIDPMTADHLRIDGIPMPGTQFFWTDPNMSERDRASLADEILRLQVECFRSECIRQQSWLFGRDWSLAVVGSPDYDGDNEEIGILTEQSARQCCFDIAEIAGKMDFPLDVAGHGSIILYRFTTTAAATAKPLKTREASLAALYLANKAHVAARWKPLKDILEAGFGVVYPGAAYNADSEEVKILGERVRAAERDILAALQFDVFWEGTESILTIATGRGKLRAPFVEDVFKVMFSGQFLSSGATVWLRYEPKYIFAVAAAFLKADLWILVPAFSLQPFKVSEAANRLVESASFRKSKYYAHPVLGNGKAYFEDQATRIEETCAALVSKENMLADLSPSHTEARNEQIAQQAAEFRLIPAVSNAMLRAMIPSFEDIEADSLCSIRMRPSTTLEAADIWIEGHWRGAACAEHRLRSTINDLPVGISVTSNAGDYTRPTVKAKNHPGVVTSSDILVADGWEGTIQSNSAPFDSSGRFGGKCCMPSKITESNLRAGGLAWWIPPRLGACVSGSIPDLVGIVADPADPIKAIASLAQAAAVDPKLFPLLTSFGSEKSSVERCMAISVQRWPSKKVEDKEVSSSGKKAETDNGFSPAALQEMQLLMQLHGAIPSHRGHPNFVLPVGVAASDKEGNEPMDKQNFELSATLGSGTSTQTDYSIFSLFRSSEENNKNAEMKKRIESCAHLVFQPSPFVLQRFLSRKNWENASVVTRPLIVSWFYDCLSALIHCHNSHILLRSIGADNLIVNQCGTVKVGGLYRGTVLSGKDRDKMKNPVELARATFKVKKEKQQKDNKRKRKSRRSSKEEDSDDNKNFEANAAPEILLGCPKHSKASDVWSMGFILAGILTGKPLWAGHDRDKLLTALYKVTGTPSKANYEIAAKYPYYKKPEKKYGERVVKVLQQQLQDRAPEFEREIDLVSRMLRLDPDDRCTAEQALSHEVMVEYQVVSRSDEFRAAFARDWLTLKKSVISMSRKVAEDDYRKHQVAVAMAPSRAANPDDLYAMEDLLSPSPRSKKAKYNVDSD